MILGTGIDIIEVDRIARSIKRWGDNFLGHVFTPAEIKYCRKFRFPAEHFAARFAAKEAVLKAIGDNAHVQWKDIEILNDEFGRPLCHYHNTKFKHTILISITHTRIHAAASAIIVQKSQTQKKSS